MRLKITALTLALLLLTGCAAYNDVETLLRAPQLSGESAALQKMGVTRFDVFPYRLPKVGKTPAPVV